MWWERTSGCSHRAPQAHPKRSQPIALLDHSTVCRIREVVRRFKPVLPFYAAPVARDFARESIVTENERNELDRSAIEDISRVLGRDFASPKVTLTTAMTAIAWLQSDVAIELEIDWLELAIFCLLVRLEEGKLPEGYYISNGKPCRYHLQKLIEKRAWNTNPEALAVISKQSGQRRDKGLAYMRNVLSAYGVVLTSCVEHIRTEGHAIFANS